MPSRCHRRFNLPYSSSCSDATDYPGGNSLSRNISTVFPTNQTGFPGTTLPPPISDLALIIWAAIDESSAHLNNEVKSAKRGGARIRQDSIPYFADKKARSLGGAACATSCQVDIFNSVRNSTGFTHLMTAYQASARSGRRASIRTQHEHCRA